MPVADGAAGPAPGAAASVTSDGGRWQRVQRPLLTVAAGGLAATALHLRDPHASGSWGYCPSNLLFGVYCPGCGGLRAVNDLTHLDLGAAASSNLLFVASLPLIAWLVGRWTLAAWRGEEYRPRVFETRGFYVVLVVVLLTFAVVRNLPQGAWLAP